MSIIGILLMVAGFFSATYGIQLNNDIEAQLVSVFQSGSSDPGTIWIILGAVVFVMGLIALIYGYRSSTAGEK